MEEIYNNVLISGHGALIRAMISVVVLCLIPILEWKRTGKLCGNYYGM